MDDNFLIDDEIHVGIDLVKSDWSNFTIVHNFGMQNFMGKLLLTSLPGYDDFSLVFGCNFMKMRKVWTYRVPRRQPPIVLQDS